MRRASSSTARTAATVRVEGRLERVHAVQRSDGMVVVAAESDAGVDHVRFALGIDDDHSEFLRRFADDPLLGETLRRLRGLGRCAPAPSRRRCSARSQGS